MSRKLTERAASDVMESSLAQPWEVLQWRVDELKRAGYPPDVAIELAESSCDLHQACEMIAAGCSFEDALRILT